MKKILLFVIISFLSFANLFSFPFDNKNISIGALGGLAVLVSGYIVIQANENLKAWQVQQKRTEGLLKKLDRLEQEKADKNKIILKEIFIQMYPSMDLTERINNFNKHFNEEDYFIAKYL